MVMNLWKSFNISKTTAILVSMALTSLLSASAEPNIRLLDRVVAIVNDDIVLESELNQRTISVYQSIKESGTQAPTEDILKQQVLERLISERLQLNLGFNAGVRIPDQEIDQAITRLAANNNLSVEDYVAQVHASGRTMSVIRQEIANEMIMVQVQQGTVMRNIRINEQELNNFLNSEEGTLMSSPDVHLGQILISVAPTSSADEIEIAQQKLDSIVKEINQGTDFKQLAIANSDDQSALEGGDLGWRKLAQLPNLFTAALKNLKAGEISQPIKSGAGFHLLKLYEKRGGEEQLIEQHFARHILLKPNQIRNEAETISFLNNLRTKIAEGENFEVLAKQHSEDLGSALKGGELGWSTPGLFVLQFEQTMDSIALNEVSKPFQTQFGWHVLQVTERRMQDFSDDILRNRADNLLRQRKFSEELQVWLQKIRDEAYIEIKEI